MRHIVILFIFLSSLLFSSDIEKIESKILISMIDAVTTKSVISVFTDNEKTKKLLPKERVTFTDDCEEADLVIVENDNMTKECALLPIITLKYDLLKVYPSSIGSFFWQKGRPNIVFIKSRLKEHNIIIDDKFNDYIEDDIW